MNNLIFGSYRLFQVFGVAFLLAGLLSYRSPFNHPVLDRYSYPFTLLLLLVVIWFIAASVVSLRAIVRTKKSEQQYSLPLGSFDWAVFAWGLAYFISAGGLQAGRLIELNFFGSIQPWAVVLEWFAMVLFTVAGLSYLFKRISGTFRNVILLMSTLIVILLFVEGFVRIRAIISPQTQGVPTYSSKLWQESYVVHNELGFRDSSHPVAKPESKRRLMVIGDSFAFGWGLTDQNQRFGEQLANRLNEINGQLAWESINFSRGDTDTRQHIQFTKQAMEYNPDMVILLYVFNDIDYLKSVTMRQQLSGFFGLPKLLFKNSYTFQEGFVRYRLISMRFGAINTEQIEPYFDDDIMAQHMEDLAQIIDIATENGTAIWIVPFDHFVKIDSLAANRHEAFVSAVKTAELPIISIEDIFAGYEFMELRVNKFDSHPNELAHNLAAKAVAEQLVSIRVFETAADTLR